MIYYFLMSELLNLILAFIRIGVFLNCLNIFKLISHCSLFTLEMTLIVGTIFCRIQFCNRENSEKQALQPAFLSLKDFSLVMINLFMY